MGLTTSTPPSSVKDVRSRATPPLDRVTCTRHPRSGSPVPLAADPKRQRNSSRQEEEEEEEVEEEEKAMGFCMRFLEILCAIVLPPLGVFFRYGCCKVITRRSRKETTFRLRIVFF
ncbi:hypothetical protein B296_00006333, partial [Ensete ventricosum]